MPSRNSDDGLRGDDLEPVRRVMEAAWDEEPPRNVTADDLCGMFPGDSEFHSRIRAAVPEWRRQLLQEDISSRLRSLLDQQSPITEQDIANIVGQHVELLDWARQEANDLRARIVPVPQPRATDESPAWTREQFLEYANRHLQLKDYEGDRATYHARLLRPGGGARKRIQRDFELTGVVGQGGLGVVFSAIDHVMHRSVAIKMVRPDRSRPTGAFDALTGEAQIAAKLEHPNILPVYGVLTQLDADAGDFEPAYVMRLLPAQRNDKDAKVRTLREEIEDLHARHGGVNLAGTPEFRRLLQRFVDVCRGVSLAHSRLVVHCDLKPTNIVSGPFGESLVHDWGICKVLDRSDTSHEHDGTFVSTSIKEKGFRSPRGASFEWCSPEQRDMSRERQIRQPADVFALGVILHCILTNRFPPPRKHSEPPELPEVRLQEAVPGMDPQLRAIVAKATSAAPWDRYIGRYERMWYEENKLTPASPVPSRFGETPGVEQLAVAVQSWLDATARAQIEHPFRRTIRRLIVAGVIAALLISTIVASVWSARERNSSRSINQLAGFAFSLAPQLGDADLDSVERLDVLDRLLQTTKETGAADNAVVRRGLAEIQLGRCKVLRRLCRFREAEEAAVDARRLLEGLSKSADSPADKALLLRVLHELADVGYRRGDIPLMREAVGAALDLIESTDADTANTVDWLLLRSVTQQKTGFCYYNIGNPFLDERAQASAVKLAEIAAQKRADDESRLNLGRAQRLHAAAVADVALAEEPPNQVLLKRSADEALRALATLDTCGESKRDSRVWLEQRYQTLNQLVSNQSTMANLTDVQKWSREVDQQLSLLRTLDSNNPEWQRLQILSDANKRFFQSDKTDSIAELDEFVRGTDEQISALRDRHPEDRFLQCHPESLVRALVALTKAGRANVADRRKYAEEAEQSLDEYEAALWPWAERMPSSIETLEVTIWTNQLRTQAAAYLPDRASMSKSPRTIGEKQQSRIAFYQARLRDDPNEPTWNRLIALQLRNLSDVVLRSGQVAEARRLRAEAVLLSRELVRVAPHDAFLCRQLAQLLHDTSGRLAEPAQQGRDEKEALGLLARACELTSADERFEFWVMLEGTYSEVLPKLRSSTLAPAFSEAFGPYDYFLRQWRELDDRLFVEDMKSVTPWRSWGERPIVFDAVSAHGETRLDEISIEKLEVFGRGFRTDRWNRDRELVVSCADALRHFRNRGNRALSEEVNTRMASWIIRSAAAAINRLQARGELGKWLAWIGQHTDKELQAIRRGQPIGWSSSVDIDRLWLEMRYADLARSAIEAEHLDQWFALITAEFQHAADVPRSTQNTVTFAEDMVLRQLVDDVAVDAKLCEQILSYIRDHGDEMESWGRSFRRALGAIAALSNDPFLARRLDRDSLEISLAVRPRIESDGLQRRQFAAVREFSENALVDAHCELELGRSQESLRLLDSLAPDTPLVAGWRARARLEALRRESLDLEDRAEMARQLSDVASADPETDFQQAFVAAYVKVLRSQSPTDAAALAELTKHPYCSDYVWALMLVGDAWMRAGDEQRAAQAYVECGQEFSPGTADDDKARKWLTARRRTLRVRS